MGKSSGGSSSEGRVRYAEYVEDRHKELLGWESNSIKNLTDESPFGDYQDLDVGLGFFGAGYVLASFPSLYDM